MGNIKNPRAIQVVKTLAVLAEMVIELGEDVASLEDEELMNLALLFRDIARAIQASSDHYEEACIQNFKGDIMENVTVNKTELLEKLRENRNNHRAIFEEAVDGYQTEALNLLHDRLDKIRKNKLANVLVSLPIHEDHTKDYDRAISMVTMSINEEITISEYDFAQYVMDDWAWKQMWLNNTANYSATAARSL